MKKSVTRRKLGKNAAAAMLVRTGLCAAIMVLPLETKAQVAGGSQAGGGAPIDNTALLSATTLPPEPPQCLHRTTDHRPSTNGDDKRLTIWLSVRQQAIATIRVNGYATGEGIGTLDLIVTLDGNPVAHSPEVRGAATIYANASASVPLLPGRQYKITAKPTAKRKALGVFAMDVGVGQTCP